MVLLNKANSEKFTPGDNEFRAFIRVTRSAKVFQRILHLQCDLESLYLLPHVSLIAAALLLNGTKQRLIVKVCDCLLLW